MYRTTIYAPRSLTHLPRGAVITDSRGFELMAIGRGHFSDDHGRHFADLDYIELPVTVEYLPPRLRVRKISDFAWTVTGHGVYEKFHSFEQALAWAVQTASGRR